MVFARHLADDALFQARERAERVNHAVMQIKLAFRNVAGVIRHRMRHVIARHRRDRQNRDRPCAFEIAGFFIALRQLRVQIPHVAARGRNAFQRDAQFLHRVRIRRHVGHQHQHALMLLHREFLRDCQRHIRHGKPLDNRIRGEIDKHHRAVKHAMFFELRAEKVIIIENQP